MTRVAVLLGCLYAAAVALGAEPDGAVAEPARWTGPNGPASHSRGSRAMPVVRDVVEAWAAKLPGPAMAPLVHWDGKGYVLCDGKRNPVLCAIALKDGRVLGTKQLPKAPHGDIHVWGGRVFLRRHEHQISAFRHVGKTFLETWKYSSGKEKTDEFTPGGMVVHDNEVYVVSHGSLLRVAPGAGRPVWAAFHKCRGTPAVYGNFVFVLGHSGRRRSRRGLSLFALERSTGRVAASVGVGSYAGGEPGFRARGGLTIGPTQILVRAPAGLKSTDGWATHAFVPFHASAGAAGLRESTGLFSFGITPAVYRNGLLAAHKGREWHWWHDGQGEVLAEKKFTPDLFRDIVPATVLGDVAYFGSWAADVQSGEILWRLPLRTVRYGAVPADRLILVLDGWGVLHGYRERVGG